MIPAISTALLARAIARAMFPVVAVFVQSLGLTAMHEALLAGGLDVVLAPTKLALDLDLVKVDEVYVERTHTLAAAGHPLMGLADALRQPADGYTVYLLASPATLVAPVILPTFKTDIQNSLAPVGLMAWSYNVLIVGANSTYKSPQDIVAAAKAKPGSLSFASGGNGTPAHLAGELFKQKAGMQAVHVPYNQFSMAITDMVSGRLDFMFLTSAAAIPQIAGGKVRALAASGTKRLAALPEVPTMGEQGFPEVVARSFEMMTVKHGTPPEVIEKLNAALNAAIGQAAVKEKFDGLGLVADPMSPGQAIKTLSAEQASRLAFVRSISLKAEQAPSQTSPGNTMALSKPFKVAAVQAAPHYLDVQASVEKACQLIVQAAATGAVVAGFPESWLPGYPFFAAAGASRDWWRAAARYLEASIEVPGPKTDRLCAAARDAGIDVVIGVIERDTATHGSVHCTILTIGREGRILGRHRKTRPKPFAAEQALEGASQPPRRSRDLRRNPWRASGFVCRIGSHFQSFIVHHSFFYA